MTAQVDPHQVKLLENVDRLLTFAISQAVVPINDDLIDRAVAARRTPIPYSQEAEAELWKVYNALEQLIHPATSDSVATINRLNKDQLERPGFFRLWWKDQMARRQILGSISWVVVTLIPLVFLQCYSISLSTVSDTIDKAQVSFDEQKSLTGDLTLALAAKPDDPQLMAKMDAISSKIDTYGDQLNTSYAILRELTAPLKYIYGGSSIGNGAATKNKSVDATVDASLRAQSMSKLFLRAVSHYLLPLLYGLLGADVYILRQMISKLDGWSLNAISVSKHHLRRALGILLGASVGLIFEDDGEAVAKIGLGLATSAFLAGYSCEFIFSVLDTIIQRAKDAFSVQPEYSPANPPVPIPAGLPPSNSGDSGGTGTEASPQPGPAPAPQPMSLGMPPVANLSSS